MLAVVLLAALAVLDGGFAGFRVAAGRNASVRKWANGYYPRAIGRGAAAAGCLLTVPGLVGLGFSMGGGADLPRVLGAAAPSMLAVFGPYATIVLAAFLPWTLFGVEVRTLVSVVVFGPLTLVRTLVVVTGWAWVWVAHGWGPAAAVLGAGAAGVLGIERVLMAWPAARVRGVAGRASEG